MMWCLRCFLHILSYELEVFANVSTLAKANAYVPNWGQIIFQSAKEIANNNVFRQRIHEFQQKASEEREWWGRKKASIQEGFMKELEQEELSAKAARDNKTTPLDRASQTATTTTTTSVTGSDDDAVLVEAEAPVATPNGGKKKKKGKK
jgi:translocation protein SEC66